MDLGAREPLSLERLQLRRRLLLVRDIDLDAYGEVAAIGDLDVGTRAIGCRLQLTQVAEQCRAVDEPAESDERLVEAEVGAERHIELGRARVGAAVTHTQDAGLIVRNLERLIGDQSTQCGRARAPVHLDDVATLYPAALFDAVDWATFVREDHALL